MSKVRGERVWLFGSPSRVESVAWAIDPYDEKDPTTPYGCFVLNDGGRTAEFHYYGEKEAQEHVGALKLIQKQLETYIQELEAAIVAAK